MLEIKDSRNFEEQMTNACFYHSFEDSDEQAMLVCARYYDQAHKQEGRCSSAALDMITVFSYLREDCGFHVEQGTEQPYCFKDKRQTCGLVKDVNSFTFYVWPHDETTIMFRMIVTKDEDHYYKSEIQCNILDFAGSNGLQLCAILAFERLVRPWFNVFVKECITSGTHNYLVKKTIRKK